MKSIIFYFLSLLSLPAFGQVVKDTIYQVNQNGKFYEVREVENLDGSGSIVKTLIGDTLTIFDNYLNGFVSEGTRMANDARSASQFDRIIGEMADRNADVFLITGREIFDTLTARYAIPLLIQGWTITVNDVQTDVEFSINAQGQLRYEITGFQTRNANIIANTMRLNNYAATGKSLYLFKSPGGNWFTIDDRVKLKFPGNPPLNR